VALQGTIDTFELTEVLRLLDAGGKTGVLRLDGSRGSGRLWVDEGKVTGVQVDQAPRAEGYAEALFEMLRFEDGSFTFSAGDQADEPGEPTEIEGIIADAETQLAEWREIERVVPTTRAGIRLRRELSRADVVLDKQRWRLVAAIGGGVTVATLGDAMDMGELPISRAVKELIELGVVDLDDAPVDEAPYPAVARTHGAADVDVAGVVIGTEPVLSSADPAARAQLDEFAAGFGLTDSLPYDESGIDAPIDVDPLTDDGGPVLADFGIEGPSGLSVLEDLPFATDAVGNGTAPIPDAPAPDPSSMLGASNDAAEVARQLSNLSPAAARAVAAAAKATTEEEREAALASVVQEGEPPIDRELLLRFLASVKS
jgi:hypothetical protein